MIKITKKVCVLEEFLLYLHRKTSKIRKRYIKCQKKENRK